MAKLRTNVQVTAETKGAQREVEKVKRGLKEVSKSAKEARSQRQRFQAARGGGRRSMASLKRSPFRMTSEGLLLGPAKITRTGFQVESPFVYAFGDKAFLGLAALHASASAIRAFAEAKELKKYGASGMDAVKYFIGQSGTRVFTGLQDVTGVSSIAGSLVSAFGGFTPDQGAEIVRKAQEDFRDFFKPAGVSRAEDNKRFERAGQMALVPTTQAIQSTEEFIANVAPNGVVAENLMDSIMELVGGAEGLTSENRSRIKRGMDRQERAQKQLNFSEGR